MRPSLLTPELVQALSEKYKNGVTIPQLAEEYHLSRPTISKALKEAGITPQRQDNLFVERDITPDVEHSIVEEYKAGESINKLQKKFGFPYLTIDKILTKNGITKEVRSLPTRIVKTKAGDRTFLGARDQEDMIEDYMSNQVPKQRLADKYGVSLQAVDNILTRNNVPARRDVSPEMEKELCDEFNKGLVTIYDLSAIYNLHPSAIRYVLTKNGIDVQSHTGNMPTQQRIKEMCREASPAIIQALIDEALNPNNEKNRDAIMAGLAVLDRAWGKVTKEEGAGDDADTGPKTLKLIPKNVSDNLKK